MKAPASTLRIFRYEPSSWADPSPSPLQERKFTKDALAKADNTVHTAQRLGGIWSEGNRAPGINIPKRGCWIPYVHLRVSRRVEGAASRVELLKTQSYRREARSYCLHLGPSLPTQNKPGLKVTGLQPRGGSGVERSGNTPNFFPQWGREKELTHGVQEICTLERNYWSVVYNNQKWHK